MPGPVLGQKQAEYRGPVFGRIEAPNTGPRLGQLEPEEPAPASSLDEATERALWPSLGGAIQDTLRGLAITGTNLGQIAGRAYRMPGVEEYYKEQEALLKAEQPESTVGAIMQDISRFASMDAVVQPFFGGLGMATKLGRFILGPSVSDMLAFDHDEARLSNVIEESVPQAAQPLLEYLSADAEDSEAEGRFKQALEGILLGTTVSKTIDGVGSLWAGAKRLRERTLAQADGTSARPPVPADPRAALDLDADRIRNDLLGAWQNKDKAFNGKLKDWNEEQFTQLYMMRLQGLDKRGIYTSEDMLAKREQALQQLKKNAKPVGTLGNSAYLDATQTRRQKVTDLAQKATKLTVENVRKVLTRNLVDSSGNVSRELLAKGGTEGARAVEMFSLARGGSMRGRFYATRANEKIFSDLATGEKELLSDLISMRRDAAIKVRKPNYKPAVDLGNVKSANIGAFQIGENIETMRTRIGEEAFTKINQRADEFFLEMRTAVDVLESSGVLDTATATKLKRFEYSPTVFLDEFLDPVYQVNLPKKGPVSIRDSGIPFLKMGKEAALIETDPQFLLDQVITRAHSRAARNEASQALLATAEKLEASGEATLLRKSAPAKAEAHNWQQLAARVDGKTENFYIDRDLVEEWIINPHSVDALDRFIGVASGAPLTRALATGINPLFAVKNISRDLMLSWIAADRGKLYSAFGPKFLMEISQDLKTVLPDAWRRSGGRFEEYLQEGGGMYLLSHQGRVYKPDRTFAPAGAIGKFWEKAEHYLGYLNETQETAMRLAIRERALRKLSQDGKVPITPEMKQQATFVARDYMDYARGGLLSKRLDNIVPYTSARIEGYATALRAAKTNPKEFSLRMGQVALGAAGIWLYNHEIAGPKQTEISVTDRLNNITVLTPQETVDAMGNTRNDYLRVPIDQSASPIFAAVYATLDKMVYGKDPSPTMLEAFKQMASTFPNLDSFNNIPMARAISGLQGQDTWRNEAVWKGDDALPSAYQYDDRTPAWAIGLGKATGPAFDISPAELATAVNALGGTNFYTQAMNLGADLVSSIPGEVEYQDQSVGDMIRRIPGGRSFVGKTHPLNALERDMGDAMAPAAVARKQAIDSFDDALRGVVPDSSKPMTERQYRDVVKFIEQNATNFGEFVPALLNRAKTQYTIDQIFKKEKPDPMLIKPAAWWLEVSTRDPAIRADLFLEEYANLDNRKRSDDPKIANPARIAMRQMLTIAKGLGGFDPKESTAFAFRLDKMAQERGLRLR